MKYITLIIILLSFFSSSFSQANKNNAKIKPTKTETKDWISKNISSHPFISEEGDIRNEYSIKYDEINIIIENKSTYQNEPSVWTTKIKVTEIDSIFWSEKLHNVWLTIILKEGKEEVTFHNSKKVPSDGKMEFLLSKTFLENDLPKRMIKAFKRLIEIYSTDNKAKNDTF